MAVPAEPGTGQKILGSTGTTRQRLQNSGIRSQELRTTYPLKSISEAPKGAPQRPQLEKVGSIRFYVLFGKSFRSASACNDSTARDSQGSTSLKSRSLGLGQTMWQIADGLQLQPKIVLL